LLESGLPIIRDLIDPARLGDTFDGQPFKRKFVGLVEDQKVLAARCEQHCVSTISRHQWLRLVHPRAGDETRGAASDADRIASFATARPEQCQPRVVVDDEGTVRDERMVVVASVRMMKGSSPRRLRGGEEQGWIAASGSQVVTETLRIDCALPRLQPFVAEDQPRRTRRVHEQGAVETHPLTGGDGSVAPGLEQSVWTGAGQHLGTAAAGPVGEGREHPPCAVVGMHLGCPELGFTPEPGCRAEGGERPPPVLEVIALVAIEPDSRPVPRAWIGRPEQQVAVFVFHDVRITDAQLGPIDHTHAIAQIC
jgi:hypothetical protein